MPALDPDASYPLLFLSHAGADTAAAQKLKQRIEAAPSAKSRGLKVWLDKDDLVPGQDWQAQLEEALCHRATAFAVYVGTGGVINWVEREVRLALARATAGGGRFPFIPIISQTCAGSDSLPGFARQFQGVFDIENRPEELQKLIAAALGEAEVGVVELEAEPFLGLSPVDEERSHLFFGRERETDELLLRLHCRRLLLVTGDSGSGKSSLVRAGLIPRWRGGSLAELEGRRPDREIWHVVDMQPRADPRRSLADAVERAARQLNVGFKDMSDMAEAAETLSGGKVRRALRCGLPPDRTHTLLVVDQFEEVVTATPTNLRQPFIELLLDLADSADDDFFVVLTMRRDYYNLCSAFPQLYGRLEADDRGARYLLGRMREEDLRRVVTEPLKLAGVEEGDRKALADSALKDVGERPGDLALLQFALTETWRRRHDYEGDLLRSYAAVGRVEGALAGAAERVYTQLLKGDVDEGEIEGLFVRLVRLGDAAGAMRRVAGRREFDEQRWALAQKLASEGGNRLVLIEGDLGDEAVEIAHEALVTQWPRFQRWLQEAARDKRTFDRLIEHTAAWLAGDRNPARLVISADREEFSKLSARRANWLSADEHTFVRESDRAHAEREAEDQRRLEQLRSARQEAERQRLNALLAYCQMAAGMGAAGDNDTTRALLLALETTEIATTEWERQRIESVLLRAIMAPRERRIITNEGGAINVATFSPDGALVLAACRDGTAKLWDSVSGELRLVLEGHAAQVFSAVFSPDGRWVTTASADGTARIWDVATGELSSVLSGHDGDVYCAAFSPDGQMVVTASRDATARLWSTAGASLHELKGHDSPITYAAWASDGRSVITASNDRTARVWNVASGTCFACLEGHSEPVYRAAFAPDSQRIVTASWDGTGRLWDAATGTRLAVLEGHGGGVEIARFSPDGEIVLTGSNDSGVRLWSSDDGNLIGTLGGHRGQIFDATFSPDGRSVASASDDGTLRLWDVRLRSPIATLKGHSGAVWSAAFSANGRLLVSASDDGTARIWDPTVGIAAAILEGHTGEVFRARFSPAGHQIATCGADGTARLWDASSGALQGTLAGHGDEVWDLVYAPCGRWIVTVSKDGTAKLWDAGDGVCEWTMADHKGWVGDAAFSADGMRIATCGEDGTPLIWAVASRRAVARLEGHDSLVRQILFAPDDSRLVTVSDDGTGRLWDAATGHLLAVLKGHEGAVVYAAMSSDGALVATASLDGTIGLFDGVNGSRRGVLRGHKSQIWHVALSADGRRILSASHDNQARIWDASNGAALIILEGHRGRVVQARFCSTGRLALTVSWDWTARLWHAATGLEVAALEGHADRLHSAVFSPDGRRVLTASADGTARVFDLPVGPEDDCIAYARRVKPRDLTADERRFYGFE
jgi:WD40 repeat protein